MGKNSLNEIQPAGPTLSREMTLLGLVATGACSMVGAGVNVLPIMLQRNVPGIGPFVIAAYLVAIFPAILAAIAYAILSSAMPRAGGSYLYVSRSLHPFLGFIASFSQWFGLSVAAGVVAYLLIPFIRDICTALGLSSVALALDSGPIRVALALAFIWIFTIVNLIGIKVFAKTVILLMFLMLIGGFIAIPAGFIHNHSDFIAAIAREEGRLLAAATPAPFNLGLILAASAVLFSTFIGFDSIAQAGGEAKNPNRTLPLAIGISIVTVGTYYILLTSAVYHTVPWNYIAERGATQDLTGPGLLGHVLSPGVTVVIVFGAAISLANSLPGMVLSVSRVMFAWAKDGIFPQGVALISRRFRTPYVAIILSSIVASASILGSHFAGDFFLGVDILVTAMLIDYFLVSLSVLALPHHNPELANEVRFLKNRPLQLIICTLGSVLLGALLVVQIIKDLRSPVKAWYFHSTWMFLFVTAVGVLIFFYEWQKLHRKGADIKKIFSTLP